MTVLYENSATLLFTQTEYILRIHAKFNYGLILFQRKTCHSRIWELFLLCGV